MDVTGCQLAIHTVKRHDFAGLMGPEEEYLSGTKQKGKEQLLSDWSSEHLLMERLDKDADMQICRKGPSSILYDPGEEQEKQTSTWSEICLNPHLR